MMLPEHIVLYYFTHIFFSGTDTAIGLSDFLTIMSQPSWIWSEIYDFPRLTSLNDLVRNEIQTFFNYDTSLEYSENLKLKKPNFEKDSLKSVCNTNFYSANLTNYCKMLQNLPDLQLTMQLMNLALSPPSLDGRNIKERQR